MIHVNSDSNSINNVVMPAWWADFTFQSGMARCWQIASLQLWLQRLDHEWRLAFREKPENSALDIISNGEEVSGILHRRSKFLYSDSLVILFFSLGGLFEVISLVTALSKQRDQHRNGTGRSCSQR